MRADLVAYLRANGIPELYCCWAGDEVETMEHRQTIAPGDIVEQGFVFVGRTLFLIEYERAIPSLVAPSTTGR